MLKDLLRLSWFEDRKEYGAVFIRLIVGFHLVWNTMDNVFSFDRMLEFRDFLAQHGFPFPLFCAILSAYAQFVCGSLYVLGAGVRYAALVMIVNFIVALLMVHVGLPEQANFPPLMMLFGSLFLLFNGAGPLSVDRLLARRGGRVRRRQPA
jgi:putative oxidoreductase